jgi:hypothetical protein
MDLKPTNICTNEFFVYLSFAVQKRTTYRALTSPSSEHSTPNQEQGLKLSSFQSNKAPYGSASIAALNLSRAAPAIQQRNNPKQSQKQKSGNNHPLKRFKAQHDTFMIQRCALLKCQQAPLKCQQEPEEIGFGTQEHESAGKIGRSGLTSRRPWWGRESLGIHPIRTASPPAKRRRPCVCEEVESKRTGNELGCGL